jgi:hypothetical protein
MRRVAIALLIVVSACKDRPQPRMQNADTITQRQHDSVIGASGLPGAQGIAKAQHAQDVEAAHTRQVDSTARDTTP